MKVRLGKHRSLQVKGDGCRFIGDYETSPNGRYTITWVDGHITIAGNLEKGMRHNVPGKFLLLDRSRQIILGSKARPNNGHVANNGTFVLCDWTFEPNSGVFYAADRSGKPLIERKLGRIRDCGISPDGRYACCQTVPGDHEDANKLHFFDLSTGELLWAKNSETGSRSKSYHFDTKKGLLYLVYPDWEPLAYNFAGEFLDAQKWQQRQIEREAAIEAGHVVDLTSAAVEGARDGLLTENGEMERHLAPSLNEQDVPQPEENDDTRVATYSEELEEQLAKDRAEHAQLKDQFAEACSAHNKELVEQRESAAAQLAQVTTEYKQLLETTKADAAEQLELLKSQIERIERERDEAAGKVVELAQQHEAALQRENGATSQFALVTAESKKQIDELTRARDQLAKERDQLLKERDQLTKHRTQLSSRIEQMQSAAQKEAGELTLQRDALAKERDQLQAHLNQALADGRTQAQALAQQCKATAKQNEQQAAELRTLETELQDRIQTLTKERDQITGERDRLAVQLADTSVKAAEHSDSLRQQVEALVKERDQIASRLAVVETELRNRIDALSQERDALASECKDLAARLSATTTDENIETNKSIGIDKAHEPGEAVEIVEAIEAGESTEADEATQAIEVVEPTEMGSVCGVDDHIRALERITDVAARRNRGQEIFTVLGEAWRNADNPITQASICRSLGELFEALDLPDKAMRSYERALIYDEAADVKQRLSSLKRKVSKAAGKSSKKSKQKADETK